MTPELKTPRSPLLAVATAFAAGITCNSCLPAPATVYLGISIILGVVWWRYRHHPQVATGCLLLVIACGGGLRHHVSRSLGPPGSIARRVTSTRQLSQLNGVIVTVPRTRPPPHGAAVHQRPTTRWQLRIETIRHRFHSEPATGRLQVIVNDRIRGLDVGDRVSLTGWLERPSTARNPGGFDMRCFLVRQGVCGILVVRTVGGVRRTGFSRHSVDRFRRWLAALREAGNRILVRHLSPRTAPVAAALLLGLRDELDDEHRNMFIRSGTMHLLAISGLHVGLLAGLVWTLARLLRCGPAVTSAMVVISVCSYALVAELRPSVLRAAVLVTIHALGHPRRRRAATANSLALSALILLGIRPGDLQSPGAQLSFLAVAALAWSAPRVIKLVPLSEASSTVKTIVRRTLQAWLVGLAIWCVTAPLVASWFGLVAPVGLLVNVLMIPLVSLALWLGVLVLGFGGWFPGLGVLAGGPLDGILGLVLEIARHSAASPLAFVETPAPSTSWLLLFYGLLTLAVTSQHRRLKSLWLVGLALALVIGLLTALKPPGDRTLHLSVLDAGHGGAILLECPNGRTLLFDAGTLGDPGRLSRTIRTAAWQRRQRRLDAVLLSHADRDHFSAAADLLGLMPVGSLLISPTFLASGQREALELCTDKTRMGASLELVIAGDRLLLDPNVSIVVRHPPAGFAGPTDNSCSVVLEIGYRGRRILLTGDIEDVGQRQLLDRPAPPIDILLAPHHGSPTANRQGWVEWARPEWVLVSGGRTTTRKQLQQAYRAGTPILCTRESGAIAVQIMPSGQIRVSTALANSRK